MQQDDSAMQASVSRYAPSESGSPERSGSASGQPRASGGGETAAQTAARKSQRQPLSCTECTRRKTRCDKVIPCQNCIKRNKADSCHLEITIKEPPVGSSATASAANIRAQARALEELRVTTTQTSEALAYRVSVLEDLFTRFVKQFPLGGGRQIQATAGLSVDGSGRTTGSVSPSLPPAGTAGSVAMGANESALGGSQQQQVARLESREGGDSKIGVAGDNANGAGGEEGVDAEADAAATLEFLAMGRSRAKSTGALIGNSSKDSGRNSDENDRSDDDGGLSGSDEEEENLWQPPAPNPASTSASVSKQARSTSPLPPHSQPASTTAPHSLPSSSATTTTATGAAGAASSTTSASLALPKIITTSARRSLSPSPGSGRSPFKPNQKPSVALLDPPTSTTNGASSGTSAGAGAGAGAAAGSSSSTVASSSSQLGGSGSAHRDNSAPGSSSSATGGPQPRKQQKGVMGVVPSEKVGRRLIQYDMEMVSWLHCSYHIPSFAAECDLFWEEGATGEVEVNRSWLALFFGVLLSSLHHMPLAEAETLFPGESIQLVLHRFLDACLLSLHEANWMGSHSLYSVQCVAIIVSPANHLGKSDLYFTMLATVIRIAQALNINHLGPDSYPAPAITAAPSTSSGANISGSGSKTGDNGANGPSTNGGGSLSSSGAGSQPAAAGSSSSGTATATGGSKDISNGGNEGGSDKDGKDSKDGPYITHSQHPNFHLLDPRALITREVCKRTWWQLVIQDFFHLPFNKSCAISPNQFDTAPPLHCTEESLFDPATLRAAPWEEPTISTHTCQLLKLAIQVHKLFDGLHSSRTISYTLILQMDAEIRSLLAEAPSYMQFDEKTGNPNPLPANPPAWLEWQRMSYLISSAHKMIILHRPFLGRAFRDPRYQQSREVCVSTAKRILRYLQMCEIEAFRKTWTVLAHSVAASVILILEFSHTYDPTASPASSTHSASTTAGAGAEGSLQLVLEAVEIFRSVSHCSSIAEKGVKVLTALIEEQLRKRESKSGGGGGLSSKRKAANNVGEELERAIKVLRRSKSHGSSGGGGRWAGGGGGVGGGAGGSQSVGPVPTMVSLGAPLTAQRRREFDLHQLMQAQSRQQHNFLLQQHQQQQQHSQQSSLQPGGHHPQQLSHHQLQQLQQHAQPQHAHHQQQQQKHRHQEQPPRHSQGEQSSSSWGAGQSLPFSSPSPMQHHPQPHQAHTHPSLQHLQHQLHQSPNQWTAATPSSSTGAYSPFLGGATPGPLALESLFPGQSPGYSGGGGGGLTAAQMLQLQAGGGYGLPHGGNGGSAMLMMGNGGLGLGGMGWGGGSGGSGGAAGGLGGLGGGRGSDGGGAGGSLGADHTATLMNAADLFDMEEFDLDLSHLLEFDARSSQGMLG